MNEVKARSLLRSTLLLVPCRAQFVWRVVMARHHPADNLS
jgi:hypothetical protein